MSMSRSMELAKSARWRGTPDEVGISSHCAPKRELFVASKRIWVCEAFDIFVDEGDFTFGAFYLVPYFVVEVGFDAFSDAGGTN